MAVINQFVGIRNTSPIRSISNNALVDAIDVDIDDEGILTRRHGYPVRTHIPGITSAYATFDQICYIVKDGMLCGLDDSLTPAPLYPSEASEFCDFGKVLFTNDGLKVHEGKVFDLKVPVPSSPPSLSVASGDYVAGEYNVVYCYRSLTTGLEGGSSPTASITIPENSRAVIDQALPIPGYEASYYMTEAGGSVYYAPDGSQLNPVQVVSDPFPELVDKVAYFEASLYVSVPLSNGSTQVLFSVPFYHHLFDYTRNYFIVQGEIRAMMPAQDSLIIGTDSAIYAYSGTLTRLTDYGIPRGRAFTKAPDGSVIMFTNRGVCVAMPFNNLTEARALFAHGGNCSTALVLQDGIVKFVALSDGSGMPYNHRVSPAF